MKLTDAEVRRMSNLAYWKLAEEVKGFKGKIMPAEIIDKATLLRDEARIDRDAAQTLKYDDLIENLSIIQNLILSKQDE